MSGEARRREEWEALRAARERARCRWRGAVDGLEAKGRDPLGLGSLIREHPVLAAGIGAAAGALVLRALNGRGPQRGTGGAATGATPDSTPAWAKSLRDQVVGFAVPWFLRILEGTREGDGATEPGSGAPVKAPAAPGEGVASTGS